MLFSKALHSLFPCPHASLHCSAHTLLLRPPLTVLLLFLQLPILLPSLLLQLPPAMLPVPFLDPPTTTPVYCIYYAVLPRGHPPILSFTAAVGLPRQAAVCIAGIQLLNRILTVAVHSSASAPFSAVQYFLSWQRSPMPPPKEG